MVDALGDDDTRSLDSTRKIPDGVNFEHALWKYQLRREQKALLDLYYSRDDAITNLLEQNQKLRESSETQSKTIEMLHRNAKSREEELRLMNGQISGLRMALEAHTGLIGQLEARFLNDCASQISPVDRDISIPANTETGLAETPGVLLTAERSREAQRDLEQKDDQQNVLLSSQTEEMHTTERKRPSTHDDIPTQPFSYHPFINKNTELSGPIHLALPDSQELEEAGLVLVRESPPRRNDVVTESYSSLARTKTDLKKTGIPYTNQEEPPRVLRQASPKHMPPSPPPLEQDSQRLHLITYNDPPNLRQAKKTFDDFCRHVDELANSCHTQSHGALICGFIKGIASKTLKSKILETLKAVNPAKIVRRETGKYVITYTWQEVRLVLEDMGELAPLGADGEDLAE